MVAMVACGFRRVFLGIETPDSASLVGAGKLQNTRSPLVEAVDTITAHGLQVMAGFILGFDGEAAGAGQRIVEFVSSSAIPVAMVGVLQALPNTALWQRLAGEGRLLPSDGRFDEGCRPTCSTSCRRGRWPRSAVNSSRPSTGSMTRRLTWSGSTPTARSCRPLPCRPAAAAAGPAAEGPGDPALASGVRRSTRWRFWHHLGLMLLRRPALLEDYLWMLALEEHFLAYRAEVNGQVNAQLALLPPPAPAPRAAEAPAAAGVAVAVPPVRDSVRVPGRGGTVPAPLRPG